MGNNKVLFSLLLVYVNDNIIVYGDIVEKFCEYFEDLRIL